MAASSCNPKALVKARRPSSRMARLSAYTIGVLAVCALWRLAQRTRIELRNQHLQRGRKVVILGAGFAGRHAAMELAAQLPRPEDGDITLIDQNSFLLFTPMLTEAAGGEVDTHHIVSSARQLPQRINFMQACVEHIDLKTKRVTLTLGDAPRDIPETSRVLQADHLVLALGSVANFHKIPGVEEHALTLKSLDDASALRMRIMALLEGASEEESEEARRALLTIVVGGAGYTGVETMAALNDLLRATVKKYPGLRAAPVRTVLVEPGPRILTELTESLAAYAAHKIEARGVEIRLNSKVTAATGEYVELNGNERIPTRTLIWSGGVTPHPATRGLSCAYGEHGGILVNAFLAVPRNAGIWALGDCAAVPKIEGGWYAPTAQNAVHEGKLVARNIAAVLRGENPAAFKYRPIGELALVGRHSGVGQIMGRKFSGLLAWALWRAVYLFKMPSPGQRLRIVSDWMVDFVLGRSVVLMSELSPQSQPPAKPVQAEV